MYAARISRLELSGKAKQFNPKTDDERFRYIAGPRNRANGQCAKTLARVMPANCCPSGLEVCSLRSDETTWFRPSRQLSGKRLSVVGRNLLYLSIGPRNVTVRLRGFEAGLTAVFLVSKYP